MNLNFSVVLKWPTIFLSINYERKPLEIKVLSEDEQLESMLYLIILNLNTFFINFPCKKFQVFLAN
jgi:hypothetical protein